MALRVEGIEVSEQAVLTSEHRLSLPEAIIASEREASIDLPRKTGSLPSRNCCLAMTLNTLRDLAARAPEVCWNFALESRGRRESRVPAGTRGLVCKMH